MGTWIFGRLCLKSRWHRGDQLLTARRGWIDLALQEYGAAASQADLLRLLVRARAPLDLSAMITSFPLDELAHTEICVRMAEELGGATPLEYPPEVVFPTPVRESGSPLLQAAKAVAWEFASERRSRSGCSSGIFATRPSCR